jgi:hypothetical protein
MKVTYMGSYSLYKETILGYIWQLAYVGDYNQYLIRPDIYIS